MSEHLNIPTISADAPMTPAEREKAAKERKEAEAGLSEAYTALLADLAMNPKKGDEIAFNGRVFRLCFVTIDTELELLDLMVRTYRENAEGDMAQALLAALPEAVRCAALILADPHYMGGSVEDAETWIRTGGGGDVKFNMWDVVAFVLKVAALQEIGQTLGKVLMPAGLAGAITKLVSNPHGLAGLASFTGPAHSTDKAQEA